MVCSGEKGAEVQRCSGAAVQRCRVVCHMLVPVSWSPVCILRNPSFPQALPQSPTLASLSATNLGLGHRLARVDWCGSSYVQTLSRPWCCTSHRPRGSRGDWEMVQIQGSQESPVFALPAWAGMACPRKLNPLALLSLLCFCLLLLRL